MKWIILILILIWASLSLAQCDTCRIGIDATMAYESVPADSLFEALRERYCCIRLDTVNIWTYDSIFFDSLDVYAILNNNWVYSESLKRRLLNWVYNGGILLLFSETCMGHGATISDLIEYPLWDLGLSWHPTTVVDSHDYYYGIEACIYRNFANHPLIPDIDSIYLNRGGSIDIKQNSKARRLVWGGPTTYALDCDSCGPYTPPEDWVIWETAPTLVAMSSYGKGVVIYHADYTNFRDYYIGWPFEFEWFNVELVLSLFNCNVVPNFLISTIPDSIDSIPSNLDTLIVNTIVTNYGAIEPESLQILLDGEIYDMYSPFLTISDSTFSFKIPVEGFYFDGDTLDICIWTICDTAGFWHYDSICWNYRVYEDTSDIINECEQMFQSVYSIYPNPFNKNTLLMGPDNEEVEIFDIRGNILRKESLPFIWDGTDRSGKPLSNGIYLIRYQNKNITKKVILLK